MGKKLFVGNLSFSSTSDDLRSLFETAGSCESASVVTDRATGRSRGFGFVEMSTPEEAQKAIDLLNGTELAGRRLNVSAAHDKGGGARAGMQPRI
jgi:RNA recognition motif-containing protein